MKLPITYVTAYKWDPIVSPYGSGDGFGSSTFDREGPLNDGVFGSGAQGALYNWAQANYDAITAKVKSGYSEKQKKLPQTLESELAAVRADGDTSKLPPVEAVTRELAVRDILIGRKTAELARQNKLANAYYGSDPLNKTPYDLAARYRPRQLLNAVKAAWSNSYTAAYNSKLLSEGISLLNNQSAALKIELTTIQARIAAEAKAKRVADEQARIAAEVKAQRLAAEAAELARLAAEAEAKSVADEQARVAAEAEAQRVAAEAEAKRVADEQARIAANTFRIPVATGTVQLSAAAGSIALTPGSTLTLDLVIERAIALIKLLKDAATVETAAGLASRWIPFAAMVWPSSLGNSDLYPATALSLPAKTLAPDLAQSLPEIAAAGGTVDVPYRIYGDRTKYSVIATQTSGGVSPKVPVRALTLDPALNAYTFTTTETPPRTLIFPIASPGSSSTATPARPVDTPVYTGVTLTPIEVKAEALPAIDWLSIKDAIYHYPIESGLPPIYAVFSSPYEGATTKGEHSGRMYNPDKAGGPTQNLDWTTASVTQEGIDLVKLHTGRFDPSADNTVMIDRLEKILRGEIHITDIDKRFYTHEVRELERYRALGVADGEKGNVWNNAHTATLEDYKVNEKRDSLYTEEAINARAKQDYTEALKEQIK